MNATTGTRSLRTQTFEQANLDRASWPIAAGLLQFPGVLPDGTHVRTLGPEAWEATLREVSDAGFTYVELTDVWLKAGDLDKTELDQLGQAAANTQLGIAAIAVIRRSVIDPIEWRANLEYSHRSIDAAAALGASVMSIGLHEPLSHGQLQSLWFWTAPGARNDPDDHDAWNNAVRRIRDLASHAAEVGIQLSLEMYEDTFLGSAESAVRLVEEIGRDNVGLNPDIGNLIRLHRPVEDWRGTLLRVLPYANYWHVKNYARDENAITGLYTAVPTSMSLGIIDYRWAIKEAIAAGFAGYLTCEHYGGDGLSVSAANERYLRTILPRTSTGTGGRPT